MTRLRRTVIAGVLLLCFATLSYGGTITGSRIGASGSRVGTITGSRVGTITGSSVGSPRGSFDNVYNEFLFRLMSVVLNGAL